MNEVGWVTIGFLVVAVCIANAGRAARNRSHPGAVPFGLLSVVLGTLAAAISIRQVSGVPAEGEPWIELFLLGGYVFTSLLWIGFVFEYTGRGPALTWRGAVGLAALGSLTIVSTVVTWAHETGRTQFGVLGQASYLSTFFLQIAVFSVGLLGVFLIARSAITYGDMTVGRAGGFVCGGLGITLLPLTIGFGQQFGRVTVLTATFGQLGLIGGLFAAVQFRSGLFGTGPTAGHLARETVLETMTEAVVVVDRTNRLLDVNAAAEATFGIDRRRLRKRSLEDVADITESTQLSDPVTIRTASGQREFAVSRSEMSDGSDAVLGHAYRFRDVTDRRTREQRIQVLNRVVRHNLRNDLDAIRGFAEAIQEMDGGASESDQYFERIGSMATGLVDLATTIERSERLLSEQTLKRERTELGAIADAVAERYRTEDITVVTPRDPVSIRSDPEIIELLIGELTDNAVTHADRDAPSVEIIVERTDNGGRVEVHDDGPGIPEHERGVLLDGEETPVAHGSGIGLWLVAWGTARLGGSLTFTERDPRGSIVAVSLPHLRASRDRESDGENE